MGLIKEAQKASQQRQKARQKRRAEKDAAVAAAQAAKAEAKEERRTARQSTAQDLVKSSSDFIHDTTSQVYSGAHDFGMEYGDDILAAYTGGSMMDALGTSVPGAAPPSSSASSGPSWILPAAVLGAVSLLYFATRG